MSARSRMTMRAAVKRSPAQPANGWGQPGPPAFVSIGTVPCFAWSQTRKEIRDDGKEAIVEDLRAIVPSGGDVSERDRLTITDRLGAVLFGGEIAVQSSALRGFGNEQHRELMLTRHV